MDPTELATRVVAVAVGIASNELSADNKLFFSRQESRTTRIVAGGVWSAERSRAVAVSVTETLSLAADSVYDEMESELVLEAARGIHYYCSMYIVDNAR